MLLKECLLKLFPTDKIKQAKRFKKERDLPRVMLPILLILIRQNISQ